MDLTISIVNYNNSKMLDKCLESIVRYTKDIHYEIYVVDNASVDGSVDIVRNKYPDVHLIVNDKNLFFAKAHNKALSQAKGRYVCILNNDTYLIDNMFKKIIAFMDIFLGVDATSPRLINPDGSTQKTCDRHPTFLYGLFEATLINTIWKSNPVRRHREYYGCDRTITTEVDTLPGSCMIVRQSTIERVGLLDENYVIYWEKIDWAKRMTGTLCHYAGAVLVHYGGVDMSKHNRDKMESIFYDSMRYYYIKHFGLFANIAIHTCLYLSIKFVKLVRKIKRKLKIVQGYIIQSIGGTYSFSGPVKLHIGSGSHYLKGWINADIEDGDIIVDATKRLPFADCSVDYIYNAHFIEHFTVDENIRMFKEFHRILKTGGVLRILYPDLLKHTRVYMNRDYVALDEYKKSGKIIYDDTKTITEWFNAGFYGFTHKFMYDLFVITKIADNASFHSIENKNHGVSEHPDLCDIDYYPGTEKLNSIVEITK